VKQVKFEPVETTTATMKNRKARTKVTPELVKKMIELEQEGYDQADIAELVGVAQATVCRNLKKAKPMKTHLTADEKAVMIKLKKEGKTSKYIARKLHRGLSTVDKVWAEHRKAQPKVGEIVPIHRRGNELYNVDVHEPVAENDVPMTHPDKVETTNAVLWLVITTVAFILGLAVAGL